MSDYYKPHRNPDWNYGGGKWKLSRSKIDLFMECPRCFYVDNKLGVARPPGFPFSLNSAVDTLLKKEFDAHRAKGTAHPLMKEYGIDAVPFSHPKLNEWRDSLRAGISFPHPKTGLFVRGGVDDVWVTPEGELIVVDYKATSKEGQVNLDAEWQDGYKRQMEVYQWLFRQNGFKVSPVGYFVYVNGKTDREAFDAKLEFDVSVLPYKGKDDWIEPVLHDIKKCLESAELPLPAEKCDYCTYRKAAAQVSVQGLKTKKSENEKPQTITNPKDIATAQLF
ncbi:MAG: PD-(D/E)XK nuclease family protein [bacterium]|nr:PD-(D/E)XK nuclease family protein [bacterium]